MKFLQQARIRAVFILLRVSHAVTWWAERRVQASGFKERRARLKAHKWKTPLVIGLEPSGGVRTKRGHYK